jgi:hypothetical protein
MTGVSTRRLAAAFALVVLLSAQGASAEPRDHAPGLRERIRHFIVTILDELGSPPS